MKVMTSKTIILTVLLALGVSICDAKPLGQFQRVATSINTADSTRVHKKMPPEPGQPAAREVPEGIVQTSAPATKGDTRATKVGTQAPTQVGAGKKVLAKRISGTQATPIAAGTTVVVKPASH